MSEVVELILDELDIDRLEKLLKDLEVKEKRSTSNNRT
jgi:hypothetical protein